MKKDKNIEKMRAEYYRQLRRWQWIDTDRDATREDVIALLGRLEELWDGLHKAGVTDLPVRLAA